MKPDVCLRCKKEYAESGHLTCKCGAGYRGDMMFIIMNGGLVEWNLITKECGWRPSGMPTRQKSFDKQIKFPWLPFDISEDKLKLYMVFS